MSLYKSVDEIVGNTPILQLGNIEKFYNLKSKIFAKLEYFNPTGSVKDRVAKGMIESAEKLGKLKKGSVIIEPTSGNTGIGLACICISKGYKVIIVMPENMSAERIKLIKAYGAKVVLTNHKKAMQGAIDMANQLAKQIPNSFIPSQFTNVENSNIHFKTTGPEIYKDLDGRVDIFVAGIGTGGTITGVGEYLKSKNPNIKIVAVEPKASPMLSKGKFGSHKIQGIGANFIPKILNTSIYDEIIAVSDYNSFKTSKLISKKEGVLVGISSGAAMWAAIQVAKQKVNSFKNIVVLLPDTGQRYLSTQLFND